MRHKDRKHYVMKKVPWKTDDSEQRDAIKEVHIMASLDHNVVRYYDSFLENHLSTLSWNFVIEETDALLRPS